MEGSLDLDDKVTFSLQVKLQKKDLIAQQTKNSALFYKTVTDAIKDLDDQE